MPSIITSRINGTIFLFPSWTHFCSSQELWSYKCPNSICKQRFNWVNWGSSGKYLFLIIQLFLVQVQLWKKCILNYHNKKYKNINGLEWRRFFFFLVGVGMNNIVSPHFPTINLLKWFFFFFIWKREKKRCYLWLFSC